MIIIKRDFPILALQCKKKRRAKGGNEWRQMKAARAVQMGNAQKKKNDAKKRVVKGTPCSRKITRGIRITCEGPNGFL